MRISVHDIANGLDHCIRRVSHKTMMNDVPRGGRVATHPKMSWEKSSTKLADLFGELAPKDPNVELKKMFGWPCCFVNGNLFAGLHKQSMIFRLSAEDQ